jgi:hypothetical protein
MHRLSSHAHTDQIVIVCSYAVVQLLQCLHESFPDCRHARSRWDRAHAHLPCIAAGRRLAPCGSESSRANTDPASRLSACRLKICKWDHSHCLAAGRRCAPCCCGYSASLASITRSLDGPSPPPPPAPPLVSYETLLPFSVWRMPLLHPLYPPSPPAPTVRRK